MQEPPLQKPLFPWGWLPLLVAVDWLLALLANLAFQHGVRWLDTLSANFGSLLLVVSGLLFAGALRPSELPELGLRPRDLLPGIGFGLLLWLGWQLAVLAAAAWGGPTWGVIDGWQGVNAGALARRGVGQLFGNALYEEVLYRGLLLMQLLAWAAVLTQRSPRRRRRIALATAFGVAQLAFAGRHLPALLLAGATLGPNLALLAANGSSFAVVYLLSGNLFAAVGFHAASNVPRLLLARGGVLAGMPTVLLLHLLAWSGAWLWRQRRRAASLPLRSRQ